MAASGPSAGLEVQGVRGGSGAMFDRIAGRYDLLNRLMSMGMDKGWRRRLVRALGCDGQCRVLDVATGTGDVALDIVTEHPRSQVVGLDPSVGMLDVGRVKIKEAGLDQRIEMVEGDAQDMPFEDDRFDAACVSFGIRNFPDRSLGLREMTRVTRTGGKVVVLELSEPKKGFMAPFARFHVHHVVPRLGSWLSGASEYRYLQQSIEAFPAPDRFKALMEEAGLVDVKAHRLSFGAVHLFEGTVP